VYIYTFYSADEWSQNILIGKNSLLKVKGNVNTILGVFAFYSLGNKGFPSKNPPL